MRDRVRHEVLLLVGLVLVVDILFIAAYFAAGVRAASDPLKLGFTALWTLVTLLLVIRGISRVRRARLEKSSGPGI